MADIDLPDIGSTTWGAPLNAAIEAVNADVETRALDSEVMHDTGEETVAGLKHFSTGITVPDATLPTSAIDGLEAALEAVTGVAGAAVVSVNGQTGTVVLDASDFSALADDATFDDIADGTTNVAFTTANRTKLTGIATDATANDSDADLRDRSTHTGTQLAASVSDFAEAARDAIGAALVAGTGVTISVNDGANTITISATGGGGGGTTYTRDIASFTTGSLAAGASETDVIGLGQSYDVQRVEVDKPARVRLYATDAQAGADVARPFGDIPTGNHGLVLDVLLDVAGSLDIAPSVAGANFEVGNVAITVTNEDSTTGTVTVDITYLRTE